MHIAAVGFDADDTLWHNEDHYAAVEDAFAELMSPWSTVDAAKQALLDTEGRNLELFGYGVKSFVLSMLETAMELSEGAIGADELAAILGYGRDMLRRPAELLPGVAEVIREVAASHRLLLITKGDLLHQERKVAMSGIAEWFHEVEVVSEKDPGTYRRILVRHGIEPHEFVMIGNSVRSDVLPAVQIGAIGVHVPYHFTWAHETVDEHTLSQHERNVDGARFWELESLQELPALLERLTTS